MIVSLLLALADPAAADRAFLARNARVPGVRAMPAVQVQVIERGPASGAHPTRTSAVEVRYTGSFADGEVFDTSVGKTAKGTAIFPLRGLIPGFQSALLQMRRGDRWRIVIPPELAYGLEGHRLSRRVLVFDMALVDFAELPPAPPPTMTELPKP